ncbi:MAG: hypothetical protein IPH33_07720 [Bacteroidetes bacterium]|nr:hypothetical protein [Bacteroidota bacterium]
MKLKDSRSFCPVAPYYITQIYYRQKKYNEVLKYAPSLLDTAATKTELKSEEWLVNLLSQRKLQRGNSILTDYEKFSK